MDPSHQPGFHPMAPVLETDRLTLRPFRLEDFEPFAALYASDRSRYIDGPVDRGEAWLFFVAGIGQWPLLGFGSFAIERKGDGACVGGIGLNAPPQFPERELGWVLWDGFEGHGFASEAALRARHFAFATLGWETAVSYIHPDNHASLRVAARLGAVHDLHAEIPDDGPTLVYRHTPPQKTR